MDLNKKSHIDFRCDKEMKMKLGMICEYLKIDESKYARNAVKKAMKEDFAKISESILDHNKI